MARTIPWPTRALVVEPNPGGHYLEYASYVVRALERHGVEVVVVTSLAGQERLLRDQLMSSDIGVIPLSSAEEVRPRQAVLLAKEAECGLVVVPSGDRFVYRMATMATWPRGVPVLALLLRSPFVSPRVRSRDWIKRLALLWVQRRFPVVVLHLSGPGPAPMGDLRLVHDVARWHRPVATPGSLSELSFEGRRWYAILGALDVRKNPDLVARSLIIAGAQGTGLVLAGQMEQGTLESCADSLNRFEELGGSVILINRRLTEEELDYLVDAVDCVVCAHSNEGPSGVMLKAAAAGQRIVAAGAQTLRRDSGVLDGCLWAELNEEAMASALADSVEDPRPRPQRVGCSQTFGAEFLSPLTVIREEPEFDP